MYAKWMCYQEMFAFLRTCEHNRSPLTNHPSAIKKGKKKQNVTKIANMLVAEKNVAETTTNLNCNMKNDRFNSIQIHFTGRNIVVRPV